MEKGHDTPQDVALFGGASSSIVPRRKKGTHVSPLSVFRPYEYPCLQTVSLGARDELLTSPVFLIGVGPVLKIEAEAMLRE